MDKNEIIERLGEIAKHAVHIIGEEPFIMSLDDGTAVREAIDIIQQSRSQSHWIPCSERLPEKDGDYYVTVDPRYVPPGYKDTDKITWRNGKWVMVDYFVIDGEGHKMPEFKVIDVDIPIIAWMPLPEGYKE